jgi:hypothetical protein
MDPFDKLAGDLTKWLLYPLLQLFGRLQYFALEFRFQISESKKSHGLIFWLDGG